MDCTRPQGQRAWGIHLSCTHTITHTHTHTHTHTKRNWPEALLHKISSSCPNHFLRCFPNWVITVLLAKASIFYCNNFVFKILKYFSLFLTKKLTYSFWIPGIDHKALQAMFAWCCFVILKLSSPHSNLLLKGDARILFKNAPFVLQIRDKVWFE